ncbi:MAG: helix-turn-helix domain-containing protein [Myxococcales bacterium]|nr:helix-turn-helix domain-containing protein [Myxococcales bacterium]
MNGVGKLLATLRGKKGKTLEEIAALTRIPRNSLVSLEADAFDVLPAPVYVKGFIRAYCQVLGADPAEMIRAYEAQLFQETPVELTTTLLVTGSAETSRPEPVQSRLKLVHALLLVVAAITFLIALISSSRTDDAGQVASTAPRTTTPAVQADADSNGSSLQR